MRVPKQQQSKGGGGDRPPPFWSRGFLVYRVARQRNGTRVEATSLPAKQRSQVNGYAPAMWTVEGGDGCGALL